MRGKGGREEKIPACGGSGEAWRGAAGVTRHVPLGALRVGLLSPGQPFWFLAWRPPGSGLSRELGEEEGSRLLLARSILDMNPLSLPAWDLRLDSYFRAGSVPALLPELQECRSRLDTSGSFAA